MRFNSMANSLFILKNDLFIKKVTWSRHLFFLKCKQNKKENPKCDSLFIYYNIEISIYKSL